MEKFSYDLEKSLKLKLERGLSFEEIIALIEAGQIVDVLDHPNHDKYLKQKMYLLNVNGYIWVVPFVEMKDGVFLKTAFPSRKYNKIKR